MSEEKKRFSKAFILFLIIIILPIASLIGLFLYQPPRHFQTGYVDGIIDETSDYALSFQNQDGLFVEPTIDTLYHTIATYYYLNNTGPFQLSDLNIANITHFLLTRQNSDGGYSDFAGAGNILSTFETIFALNWSSPSEITNNPTKMNLSIEFVNNSQLEDGGYTVRPPIEMPEEFNFDFGFGIPMGNLSYDTSNVENTHEALDILTYFGIAPPNSSETTNFINNSLPYVGCRRSYNLTSSGFAASKNILSPDLHSTYHGVASLIKLSYSKNDIDKPASNVTLYIESCWNSDGGFALTPENVSDITSTYYGVAALTLLNYNVSTSSVINDTKIIEFIANSQNADGGVGARPGLGSNFQNAHHAIATLKLLGVNISAGNLTPFHNWFVDHLAQNGLFGEKIVEAQYWGIRSAHLGDKLSFLNESSLANYLESCQSTDGGFGTVPNSSSTVIDTYAAVESLHLIDSLDQINQTAAILWLQSLQTIDGGFASRIGVDAFLRSYAPMYAFVADFILDESLPSTEATLFGLAALRRLNAWPLNLDSLRSWLLTAQNADGGFPFSIGIRSEAISTFYGIQALALIREEPYSRMSCIEFLKGCQMSDGGFSFYPLIGEFLNMSYLFITFTAAKGTYLLGTQPSDVFGAMDWLLTCEDARTNGYGDAPNFGADLRNSPYLIDVAGELNVDRSFDPAPWIQTVLTLLIVELAILGAYGVISIRKRRVGGVISGIKRTHPNIEEYPAVHVKGLTIKIGKKVILEDINMTLQHGEVLGVIGESGAGKSTFIKCILGTKGSIGDIRLYGFDIRKEKKKLRPLFGYVPQDLSKIYENFTIMENLLHFGKQYGLEEKEIIQRGAKILRDLGIFDKKDSLVSQLSGGERRRASIAVGMIHEPTLFVLDEPTSGLDPIIREQLWINLIDLAESHNTTLIVITHYPEESKFCTRVAIFGRLRGLIDFGHPQELINNLPGTGRAIDIILKETIEQITVDLLPLLEKVPEIEFVLEEKRGQRYRIFSHLPLKTLRAYLVQALGTELIELKQSEATLVDYFRIKSLEVKD
ncbi:MAG: ATP-binding cassette domain-containing protein [Candidatus Helarchaeota archaeon]|nr:ATP-binding cassette domain-containing protein [Candidatus Helarchaeota archaeon]